MGKEDTIATVSGFFLDGARPPAPTSIRATNEPEATWVDGTNDHAPAQRPGPTTLLHELVAHLRDERTALREEWARRITDARLLRS